MKNPFLILLLLTSLSACNDEEKTNPEFVFKRKIDQMAMESFKIPDSINTSLILATYYNSEYDTQTLFVYTDSTKKTVKKIDYLPDSSSSADQLEILKRNEFRSDRYHVDYVIHENSVTMIHERINQGPQPQSKEYRRTDRD